MQLSTECQMKIIVMAFDGTTGSERTQQNGNDNTAGCNSSSSRSSGIGGGSTNIIPINFYVSFICAEHQNDTCSNNHDGCIHFEIETWRRRKKWFQVKLCTISFCFISSICLLMVFFFISSVVSWFHLKMWREIWKRYQKQTQHKLNNDKQSRWSDCNEQKYR